MDLALRFHDLAPDQRDLGVVGLAPGAEQRGLAAEKLLNPRVLAAVEQLLGEVDGGSPGLLRLQACRLGDLSVELGLDQFVARVHPHVLEHQQRLPRFHLGAVADQDLADDAALLVLHRLAVHVHLHHPLRDHRAAERRGGDPGRHDEKKQDGSDKAGADEAPRALHLIHIDGGKQDFAQGGGHGSSPGGDLSGDDARGGIVGAGPGGDVGAVEAHHALKSRSQVIEQAIALLRERELEAAYRESARERDAAYDVTNSDGLPDEAW